MHSKRGMKISNAAAVHSSINTSPHNQTHTHTQNKHVLVNHCLISLQNVLRSTPDEKNNTPFGLFDGKMVHASKKSITTR